MTAQELINRALTLIGRLGAGRTPSSSESTVSFGALNAMLANWSTDRRSIYTISRATYLLTANKGSYTIGPSGNFDTPRPVRIESANIVVTLEGSPAKFPIAVIGQSEYAAIPVALDSSVLPRKLYNDSASPLSTLYLYPVPSTASSLELYVWQTLQQFAAITDTFTLPVGYERAVVYNLAIELAPLFAHKVTDEVALVAKQSKENIDTLNGGVAPIPAAAPAVVKK